MSQNHIQVGLASGFVARDVLEARSLDDAIGRVSVAGQGSGLSANMGIVTDPHRQVCAWAQRCVYIVNASFV
jgi:hypothetical protein